MASCKSTDFNCGPCLYNNIAVPGKVWCLSCKEGLCQLCTVSHNGIKATRKHKILPVEKCHNMASMGNLVCSNCTSHSKVLDLYCPSHDPLVCSLCILENHRKCKGIVSLDDVAENVVLSSLIFDIESNLLHETDDQQFDDALVLDLNSTPIEDLIDTLSLGSVNIINSQTPVQVFGLEKKEKMKFEGRSYSIDHIWLQAKIYISYPKHPLDSFAGCMICSNGEIFLADDLCKKLAIFNRNGVHVKDIPVPNNPCDMVEISQGRIAVTFGVGNEFEIADIKDNEYKTVRSVTEKFGCSGISFDDGLLAVKLTDCGIDLYGVDGSKILNIKDGESGGGFDNVSNIAIFQRRMYCSFMDRNSVQCLDMDSNLIWKYHSYSLSSPRGITTDRFGNVYVVGEESKNIFVISQDGQKGRELFKFAVKPKSVHFDKNNYRLLVRDYRGATIYDVMFDR